MSELILDETIHDDGSGDAEYNPATNQAAVDDLCLRVHPLSLLAIGEGGEASTDEGTKEQLGGEEERCDDELPKRDGVNRLLESDQQTEGDESCRSGDSRRRVC